MVQPFVQVVSTEVLSHGYPIFSHRPIHLIYEVDGVRVRTAHWTGSRLGQVDRLSEFLVHIARKHQLDYITISDATQKGVVDQLQTSFRKAFGKGSWFIIKRDGYILLGNRETFSEPIVGGSRRVGSRGDYIRSVCFNLRHKKLHNKFQIIVFGHPVNAVGQDYSKLGDGVEALRKSPNTVRILSGNCTADLFWDYGRDWVSKRIKAISVWEEHNLPTKGSVGDLLVDGFWFHA